MATVATRKFSVKGKILKEEPNELEKTVAQALYDMQQQQKELTEELKDLFILSAIEVKGDKGARSAVVVFIPYVLRQQFRKVQARLVRDLEKKFGKTFVFVAQRKILKAPTKHNTVKEQKRPYSRTVTAVHDAILEDITFPAGPGLFFFFFSLLKRLCRHCGKAHSSSRRWFAGSEGVPQQERAVQL